MVNIGADSRIPEVADMVESLNSGIGWMREWRFLEICKVPIGIAMEASHPLARLRTVPPEALAGLQVGTFRGTAYDGLPQLRSQMDALKVEPIWLDYPSASAFWECAFQHRLLLAPLCWSDMMPGLTVRPVRWPFTLPYGIFTRTGLQGEAKRFLDFIRSTYAEGDPNGIVPMLTFE